jgi:diguanylate cyclase (GGDEF)-like protein
MELFPSVLWLVVFQVCLYAFAWLVAAMLIRLERPSLLHWMGFNALLGLGLYLCSLRDAERAWWAFNGANIATLLAFVLMQRGCQLFQRHQGPALAAPWLWGPSVLALLVLPPSLDWAPWRVLLAYLSQGLMLLVAFLSLRRPLQLEFGGRAPWPLLIPILLVSVINLASAANQLRLWPVAQELHQATDFNLGLMYAYLAGTGVFAIGFMAIVTHRLTARLREASLHDELTGLLNRRAMNEYLQNQWHRHLRRRHPLALVMVDLDHFKQVNDSRGHAGGDAVLRATAALFRKHLRREDLVARMGGEEFLLLLPDTPEPAAQALCERLRQRAHEEALGVTLSLGLTMVSVEDADAETAVRRADAALYRAKSEGRDRVVCALP